MTKIYVVRHAEAEGNIYRRVQGHYNGYVTENGYRQIDALAERFKDVHIDAVYSSDLFRTQKTAEAIYKDRGIPFHVHPELREINLGIWEGIPWGELIYSSPKEYDAWTNTPHEFSVEGGETYAETYARIKAFIDKLVLENPNKDIAVVSHGGAIRALLCGLIYGDVLHLNDIGWCDNTAVACIEADENLNYNVIYKNDNSHLNELSTLNRQSWWKKGNNHGHHNLWFKKASLPRDLNLACDYHKKAYITIFGDTSFSRTASKIHIESLNSTCDGAIAFALREQEIIGAIMLDADAHLCESGGHISLIFLDEEYRNMNFGIQLLGYAVSVYRELGRKFLTVRVAEHNAHAIAFYKKYGFSEFGRELDSGTKQILMKKQIYFEL